jgi:uncharacterized protein involved in copper resistance
MGRVRLLLALLALFAVIAAPTIAPAFAASVPMEHCDDGHGKMPGMDHGKSAMDHQACCAAVEPGKAQDDHGAGVLPIEMSQRPMNDLLVVSMSSGTDPPPPRLS